MLKRPPLIWALVVVQVACGLYFIWEVVASVLGLSTFPLRWQTREFVEIGASLGLVLGAGLGIQLARSTSRENQRAANEHRLTSSEFRLVVQDFFDDLDLTRAESDVAWLLLKGLPICEISRLRNTATDNVEAKCATIYRKAGVTDQSQLFSTLVENLLHE